jgi:hypothetical protein
MFAFMNLWTEIAVFAHDAVRYVERLCSTLCDMRIELRDL